MLQWLKHLPYSGEAPRLRGEVNVEFTNKTVKRLTISVHEHNSGCCVNLQYEDVNKQFFIPVEMLSTFLPVDCIDNVNGQPTYGKYENY